MMNNNGVTKELVMKNDKGEVWQFLTHPKDDADVEPAKRRVLEAANAYAANTGKAFNTYINSLTPNSVIAIIW